MAEQTTTVDKQTTPTTTTVDEQTTPTTTTNTTTSVDVQTPTTSPLDEQLAQKREDLTQAQITQTNAYSEYIKVMKAKSIVSESDTEKSEKLDKLMYQYFTTYQNALEQSQKLQIEVSDLESQKYLEEILA